MKNIVPLFLFVFSLASTGYSQNERNEWAIDFGSASVLFEKGANSRVGYRYLESAARIGLSRSIYKDLAIAGSVSNSIIDSKKYSTLDGELRYGFGTSDKKIFNIISMYGSIGSSYLFEPNLVTLNFAIGGSLWLTKQLGLTSSLVYKLYGVPNFPGSHVYAAAGFVYQFSSRNGGSKHKKGIGGNRTRIWH